MEINGTEEIGLVTPTPYARSQVGTEQPSLRNIDIFWVNSLTTDNWGRK